MRNTWRRIRLAVHQLFEREQPIAPRRAVMVLHHWSGPIEQEVELLGQTTSRYRIRAISRTRLPGRHRMLEAGRTALVARSAVRVCQSAGKVPMDETADRGADLPQPPVAGLPHPSL